MKVMTIKRLEHAMGAPTLTPAGTVLQTFLGRFQAGDLAGVCDLIAPEAVWHEAESLPWSGEWHGPDGFAAMIGAITTPVELLVESASISDGGDVVVLRLDAAFVSRRSGRRLPMKIVEHYTILDGLVYGADVYYKDTQAVNELVAHG